MCFDSDENACNMSSIDARVDVLCERCTSSARIATWESKQDGEVEEEDDDDETEQGGGDRGFPFVAAAAV